MKPGTLKSPHLHWFYRSLHNRGVTVESLAKQIGTSRSHLTQVFNGTRSIYHRSGAITGTWFRALQLLTPNEQSDLRKAWYESARLSNNGICG